MMGVCKICQGGGATFFGGWASCKRLAMLVGGLGACFPDNFFWNGAIWCVLEHIANTFAIKYKQCAQ